MECKGLVMAGGTGLTTGILNTIENKVNKEDILRAIGNTNEHYQEIDEDSNDSYSIWGYSDRDRKFINRQPQKGDLIFITNKNAAVYFGEVFLCFSSTELDFVWKGRKGWPFKILFKEVYQIFIPDPNNAVQKNFERLIQLNQFAPSRGTTPHIEKLYNENYGFRNIIDKESARGNFQGAMYLDIDIENLLNNLELYMIKSHFECIRKIV